MDTEETHSMVDWEPPKISQDASTTHLVDTSPSVAEDRAAHKHPSRSQQFLRIFRLRVLNRVFARGERRKIAIYKSRQTAILHCLLHVTPLAGAIALLYLNLKSYYIGPDFSDTTPLQFAAKFHELLMQATIVEIVLCIIRTQVVGNYIPLGALSASVQALQLSYLWSSDFLSATTSREFPRWRKAVFVIVVPLLILLAALVGPSSAVLMIPRSGCSPPVSSVMAYTNASSETLFPSHVDRTYGMQSDWKRLNNSFPRMYSNNPGHMQTFVNADNESFQRIMYYLNLYDADRDHFSTTSTMATQFSATLLYNHFTYNSIPSNGTLSTSMPQPVVVVRSWGARLSLFGAQVRYVQDDGIHEGVLWSNVSDLIGKFGGLDEGLKDIYPPIWRTSPEPGSSSIVGSFLQYTCGNDNVSQTFRLEELLAKDCLLLLTYTVSAFWETSQVELMVNDAMPVVRTGPLAVPKPGKPEYTSPITMDLDGISYFNSISVTEALRDASPSFIAYLAALFATALCEDSKSLLLLPKQLDIYDPYELGSTPIKIFQTQYGYGYDTSTTSVRLSIAVIMTYCVVTLAYMIYILISGSTSTTWDSAMELVLLALQSRTPDHLGHISAGVDSMDTYREAVGIRVSDGDELELVFKHDRDYGERNLRKITPNRAY